jgi:hypothetical protein
MSQQNNNPELIEEYLYLVISKDRDELGNPHMEVAQYRKGKFYFFGWATPEPIEVFESWKELVVSLKNE